LVSKNGFEAEVECKFKSYDTGRKITRAASALVCDLIIKHVDFPKSNLLVEIVCNRSLVKNRSVLHTIATQLDTAIKNDTAEFSIDNELNLRIVHLQGSSRIETEAELAPVIEPYRTPNSHFAALPGSESTIVLKIESEMRERILRAIYETLKESLTQFSKSKPGLIACFVEGVLPEEWDELRGESGIAHMTYHLLNQEEAKHIHTITYSSESEATVEQDRIDHKYPALVYKNPHTQFNWAENVFELETVPSFLI
jgi:hypothetical protein